MSNISRAVSGLLFRRDTDRNIPFNSLTNWHSPPGMTLSLGGNELVLAVSGGITAFARLVGFPARSTALVQETIGAVATGGAPMLGAQLGPDDADLSYTVGLTGVYGTFPAGFSGQSGISEYVDKVLANRTLGAAQNRDRTFYYTLSVAVEPGGARYYNHDVGEELVVPLTGGLSGDVGPGLSSGSNNNCRVRRFVYCADRYVRVSGVAAGQVVAVRKNDGTVIRQVTAADTLAEVDMWQVSLIGDAYDVAIFAADGVTLVDSLAPAGGVWPGDEYAYVPPNVVAPPVIVAPTAATVADQSTPVTWTHDDLSATFKLELSSDNGGSWTTIAPALTGRTYTLDTSRLEALPTYKVRLTATVDGVSSDPATSASFAVQHTAKLKPPTASRNPMQLPSPLDRYDRHNESETRRAIETWAAKQDARDDSQATDAASLRGTDLTTAAPKDEQVLTYDEPSSKAVWRTPDDSTVSGVAVSDVAPADGEVLTFDAAANEAKWAALPDKIGGVEVDNSAIADGFVLTYDATLSKAVWKAPNVTSIDGIPIRHGAPNVAEFLRYRAASNELVWATENYAGE